MRYSNSKYWDFCAPIAGILLTLSFAPFNYAYLILVALMFLFSSWQNISAKRAALRGYLFGLGSFGLGVSWVYISIHDFGGANVIASTLITGLFITFWALFPALTGYTVVKLMPKNKGFIRIMLIPVIWMLIEYLRGYLVLNGFPWLQIAYSQLETPLSGYIPLVGVYGTGFIAVLTASAVIESWPNKKQLLLLTTALAVLWGAGGLLRTVKWTHEIGHPISFSLIQGNITQDKKWQPENKTNTLLTYKRMTEEHWDSNVIIWPETAIPAYLDQVKEFFLLPLARDAKQHNTDLIISVPVHESAQNENFNAVITMGNEESIYRKTHLLPFGEYLPLQPLSGFVLNMIHMRLGNFTAGSTVQPLLKAGGYPFITSICYEDAFGDVSIRGISNAAYLVNVTNDAWFGNSIEPHQHLQIARMRAMETGRYLLRATNTGMTAIVSPHGEIIKQAPLFTTTVLTESITPMGGLTPFSRFGDKPVITLMFILLLCSMLYGKFFKLKVV